VAANSSIDPIDIGTLRTLVLVYDLQSFSAAAKRLDVNQSTISYAVERLRGALGDPLFVRNGNGVTATERCAALVNWARDMIGEIDGLASPVEFDPATAQGSVTISCNYHERQTLIPQFSARLRAGAPRIRLVLLDAAGHGDVHLKQNQCDIVLGPVGVVGESFFRRHILTDHYVCVMDPANPLARSRIALSAYAKAEHVFITIAASGSRFISRRSRRGRSRSSPRSAFRTTTVWSASSPAQGSLRRSRITWRGRYAAACTSRRCRSGCRSRSTCIGAPGRPSPACTNGRAVCWRRSPRLARLDQAT